MNYSVKKLISIYLAGSVSLTCCLANNAGTEISNVKTSDSKISNETWQKIEKMTSDDIKKLFYISYDMLPYQYREKIDRPGYKIKKGFNVQAASKYSKSSVKRFAEKNSYKFIEVDLGLKSSIDKFKDFVDNRSENEVIIVYIHDIRCSDINSYLENVLEILKNHRFGIFVNSFEICQDKKCLEHKRMENLQNQFEFYDMDIDYRHQNNIKRCTNVETFYDIIKMFLERLDQCLDNNLNLNSEQINAICTVFSEYFEDYDIIEQLFIDAFSTLSSKKTFDFESIFTTLMSYVKTNPERFSWNEVQMKALSIHEMGHAFIRKYCNFPVTAIIMNSDFSGLTSSKVSVFDQDKLLNYDGYVDLILVSLAGRAAQDLLDSGSDLGCSNDMEKAYRSAKIALTIQDHTFRLKDEVEQKKLICELLEKLQKQVEDIILENREVILNLAYELMEKPDVNGIKFMIGSEFDRLYEKFTKEAENKKKFLEDNHDDVDKLLSKISQDPEAWNTVKSSLGIQAKDKENNNQNETLKGDEQNSTDLSSEAKN